MKRGKPDIAAIKDSLNVLKRGGVFFIFPEGTRSRDGKLGNPEPGVGLIAFHSRASIVPVAISGTYKIFSKMNISIGSPIIPANYSGKKTNPNDITNISIEIMKNIKNLMEVN